VRKSGHASTAPEQVRKSGPRPASPGEGDPAPSTCASASHLGIVHHARSPPRRASAEKEKL
jgi:hypothetical protein